MCTAPRSQRLVVIGNGMAGARAGEVDRWAKQVREADGSLTGCGKLIMTTGRRPFIPPREGLTSDQGELRPRVFAFPTIDDCNGMSAYAATCRPVAVIGASVERLVWQSISESTPSPFVTVATARRSRSPTAPRSRSTS